MRLKRSDIKSYSDTQRYMSLMEQDVKSVFFSQGCAAKDKLVSVVCHVCNSNDNKRLYTKYGFSMVLCRDCGYHFINPRPRPEFLHEYYSKSKASVYFQEKIIKPSLAKREKKIFLPRLSKIEEYVKKKGRVLDVGCSIGIFLSEAKKRGWIPFGIEFSEKAALECESKGIPISRVPIESSDFQPESFDAITMWETLEHVFDPQAVLLSVLRLLRKDGVLLMTMPNIEGADFRILGPAHTNIAPPAHLNFFSPSTVRQILKRLSFDIVEIETPGSLDVDNIMAAIENGDISSTGNEFLDGIIKDKTDMAHERRDLFQDFLKKSKLSGHMLVVARRVK